MATNPQSTQVVNEAALAVTRSAARATQATINANMDAEANTPLRLYGSNPTDSKLHIGLSQVSGADGTGKSVPPQSGTVNNAWADTTIDFGVTSSWVSGGTVTRDGASFSLPTITATRFLRMVFVFTAAGTVDTTCSDGSHTSKGTLPNPGTLFASLTGTPLGWIDLVALTGGQTYKTADSAGTSSIIENSVTGTAQIVKFGSGAGGNAVAVPLVLQSASSPNVTIAGGYLQLMDGRELTTNDGGTDTANYGKQYTFSATALQSPAASTVYHFYIDLDALGSQQTIATGSYVGRKVYNVGSAQIVVSTTAPDAINRARYVWMGMIKTTSGSAWSGTGAALAPATRMEGLNGPVAVSPVVYRLAKQLIGTVGGSSTQLAGGHVLSTKSFPTLVPSTNITWYGLAGLTDGSGNARTLTNNNAAVFTATGILADTNQAATFVGGSSQRLSSTAATFNPSASFSLHLWAKPSSVSGTQTLAATRRVSGGTQINFLVQMSGTSLVITDSTGAAVMTIPTVFANGVWVGVGLRYSSATGLATAYVNGRAVDTQPFTPSSVTSPEFNLGADNSNGTPQNFYSGVMDEVAFVNDTTLLMTDDDIRRLAAARIDHGAAVSTDFQEWSAKLYYDTDSVKQNMADWLIDMTDSNSLFVDFTDRLSTDSVSLALKDTSLTPTVVSPVPPFDTTYTSDPTGTVAHGQPDIPDVVLLMEDGTSGEWAQIANNGLVRADSTNLYLTTSGLSPAVSVSPNRLRVIARPARLASVGVPDATTARTGSVTTSKQNFAGPKVANDGLAPASNIRGSEGAGTTTFTDADNRFQTFNLSAARTAVLPSTGVVAGERWMIENRGSFDLTIQPSGGGTLETVQAGFAVFEALQATPTSTAHWRVVDVLDTGSYTDTTTGAITQTATVKWIRRNTQVSLSVETPSAAASATNVIGVPATNNPARLRPASGTRYSGVNLLSNSLDVAGTGRISSTGALQFVKYDSSNFSGTSAVGSGSAATSTMTYIL